MQPKIKTEMQAIREGLKCSNLEAVFATVHVVLTQGVFLTNYVLDLKSSNMVCGIIESLPSLVQFSYFLSPILVRRLKYRRPIAVFFFTAHRLAWLLLIALMYVDCSNRCKQVLLVLTLLGANCCAVIAGNAWFSWMTDLVPPAIRGSYYGRRNVYLGITSMTSLFIGTQLLTFFRRVDMARSGYTLCFSVAIASALFSARIMARQYEPKMKPVPKMSLVRLFQTVRHNRPLKDFIRFFIIWQFSMGISSAFFGVQMVRLLKMTPAQMGYQTLISSVAALVGSRFWGRAMDEIGERAVTLASGFLIAMHIWFWLPAREGFLQPIWVTSVLGGFSWAGFNIAVFSWLQRICGEEERQYTYGLLGAFAGPGFMLGSLAGGLLTTVVPETLFSINAFAVTHFHLVFVLSSVGRMLAIFWIAAKSMGYGRDHRTILRCLVDSALSLRR